MSRLQILINQYNEDEIIAKQMLDSIEIQKNIDLKNDIEVFIGNDGSDVKLSEDFLKQYSFPIKYFQFEHSFVAGCRKNLFDQATAGYVMFCDMDDMFINSFALSLILQTINKGFDYLICGFIIEVKQNDKIEYIQSSKDPIQVHAKVYNRQFLLDNRIIWHKELREHQDSPFNCLVAILSKNTKYLEYPLYVWKYNENSISRKNGKRHMVITFPRLIDSYDVLIDDLKNRGLGENAKFYAMSCLYSTYYELSKEIWWEEDSKQYRFDVYERLARFFYKHELLLLYTTNEKMIERIKSDEKKLAERVGPLREMLSPEEWMQTILNMFPRRI